MAQHEANAPPGTPSRRSNLDFHLSIAPDSLMTIKGWNENRPPAGYELQPKIVLVNRQTGERMEITNSEADDWFVQSIQLDSFVT